LVKILSLIGLISLRRNVKIAAITDNNRYLKWRVLISPHKSLNMKNTLVVFAAGCLGALVQCLVMWLFSRYGITHSLHVSLPGSIAPTWLYPRIVWGGLWGFLFLLPILTSSIFARSFVIALIPAGVQLFVIYPLYEGKGVAGLSLGLLTPFLVLFFYWIWALATTITLKLAK
jgi:hypothetical protein